MSIAGADIVLPLYTPLGPQFPPFHGYCFPLKYCGSLRFQYGSVISAWTFSASRGLGERIFSSLETLSLTALPSREDHLCQSSCLRIGSRWSIPPADRMAARDVV